MDGTLQDGAAARRSARATLIFCLLALYLVWGTTYLSMRVVVQSVPPFLMGSARFLLAGTILFTVLRLRGLRGPTLREWLYAAPVGACLFVLGNGFVGRAEVRLSSGLAAVVTATMPLWAAALGLLLGERTRRQELVGMGLGLAGVLVLFSGAELQGELSSAVFLMIAPIGWALGSLLTRRLPQAPGLMSAASHMLAGGAVMGAVAFAVGERPPAHVPTLAAANWLYLVAFGSLVSFSAYNWLLRNARPAVAMSYSYVNPVIAVVVGAVLGREALGPEVLPATALVTLATVVMVRARARAAPVAPVATRQASP